MQNFFANEIEAAHRRREQERAIRAEALALQARSRTGRTRWHQPTSHVSSWLRSLLPPLLPILCLRHGAAEECTPIVKGRQVTSP